MRVPLPRNERPAVGIDDRAARRLGQIDPAGVHLAYRRHLDGREPELRRDVLRGAPQHLDRHFPEGTPRNARGTLQEGPRLGGRAHGPEPTHDRVHSPGIPPFESFVGRLAYAAGMGPGTEVKLLGPLEVVVPGRSVEFEGAKQRRLFVALALRAPEARLGRRAGRGGLGRRGARRPRAGAAEAGLAPARAARRAAARPPARRGLRARDRPRGDRQPPLRGAAGARPRAPIHAPAARWPALALWRGPALADHRFDEFAQGEIARLEELRLEAIEERFAAELASGHAGDLVGELRALVAEHPLRERLRGSLMLALYRAGRQADALEVMREGRRHLVEELGLEPGPSCAGWRR